MNNRYDYIDALRGIAILGVIMAHVAMFTVNPTTSIIYRLTGEGQRGVQLFYIVSAMTLFLSLQSNNYTGKLKDTIKYFIRRFFRIAPLFYTLIFLIIIFTFIKPLAFFSYVHKDLLNFVTSLTFTNSFSQNI